MGSAGGCPRQDSNLRSRLRRAVLYPLSYGGRNHENAVAAPCETGASLAVAKPGTPVRVAALIACADAWKDDPRQSVGSGSGEWSRATLA